MLVEVQRWSLSWQGRSPFTGYGKAGQTEDRECHAVTAYERKDSDLRYMWSVLGKQCLCADSQVSTSLAELNSGLQLVSRQPCLFRDKAFAPVCRPADKNVRQCSAGAVKEASAAGWPVDVPYSCVSN